MKKLISLVLAVVLCLSLVACGSTETATNIENLATAAETQADVTEPTEAETAQELTFVLSDEPDGIDPTVTNNSFAMYVLTSCFEGLVTYDSTGSIVGGCAESWDVSDDGLVYTFHLRDGLKWSDGSDLTASD